MGLFSSRKHEEPVRRDQAMRLIATGMRETDAADRDIDSSERQKAWDDYNRLADRSTQAELRKAHEALKRLGC